MAMATAAKVSDRKKAPKSASTKPGTGKSAKPTGGKADGKGSAKLRPRTPTGITPYADLAKVVPLDDVPMPGVEARPKVEQGFVGGAPASREAGEAALQQVPLASLAEFTVRPDRIEPLDILARQAETRVPELVPIRHGRMVVSAFTFYRGAAAVMANDLGNAPSSGLMVQLCGDAHLTNFGFFASPERRLMLDINDFDETHPGPFEWDVKRLVASLVVAARDNGFNAKKQQQIAQTAARRYQTAMDRFSWLGDLDVWYAKGDFEDAMTFLQPRISKERLARMEKQNAKIRSRDSLQAYNKLATVVDGEPQLIADPPLIVPIRDLMTASDREQVAVWMQGLMRDYAATLHSGREVLVDRFEFVDMARKVVGVGSVGTRCWIVLMRGKELREPLLLQVKEAEPSVLAPYVDASVLELPTFGQQGQRVVNGHWMMQAASDIFLGWQTVDGLDGKQRDFYVRQLRDWKFSPLIESFAPLELSVWGELCAWSLARAHARSGNRTAIAAYIGDGEAFPEAMTSFALAYAEQNDSDHDQLVKAIQNGTVEAVTGL
jgi:hypothetical protein